MGLGFLGPADIYLCEPMSARARRQIRVDRQRPLQFIDAALSPIGQAKHHAHAKWARAWFGAADSALDELRLGRRQKGRGSSTARLPPTSEIHHCDPVERVDIAGIQFERAFKECPRSRQDVRGRSRD